ncbi:insulin-like peptide INSL5 isoform X2 [Hippopotamus amphibius kiboko]|uniref:insulin-like peptide INSL5 isoform X2 n=1 Tax=Hippopotamus amphibius kiboko TaxID=575201 RepID=UPI002597FE65|nr:insulin-like peptide INSL5 isoform X2 [Hippopotamus amphibius kiboko]
MRGFIFTLFLFSVLLAISEVRSEESRKLCGFEYIRTVIYICASSRWRRQLGSTPQGQQAERGNHFQLPNEQFSEENAAQNLPKMAFSEEEILQGEQLPTEGLWRSKKHSVMSRQDLQMLCCTEGCSMSDLSALC